jgi:hypothetical protein
LELECALLAGIGHDHRQHAFVYIDTRYFVVPSLAFTFPW